MTQYIKNVKRRVRVGEGPKIGIDVGSRIPGEHIHSLAKPYHLPGQIEHVEPTDCGNRNSQGRPRRQIT
jgi:hypothetical protein